MDITVMEKGASISIAEKAPNLKKVRVGAGWDVNESENGQSFDLDLTAVLLDANGKIIGQEGLVYFGQLDYKVGGQNVVHHTGDNLTGAGEGDDEQIEVALDQVPANVSRIAFLVNIYHARDKGQNFGMVKSSFVRLVNVDGDKEFARHDLQKEYASNSGVLVGELYRENNAWHFKATAEGVNGEIAEILSAKGYK